MDRPHQPHTGSRFVFDSVTINALTSALDGLAQRQRAISDNIANINTPNYHAKRVQFEEALARSIDAGDGRVGFFTGTDQPPHAVQLESAQRHRGDVGMGRVRRIKGPA